MSELLRLLLIWLGTLSVLTFLLFLWDKLMAKLKRSRIPEAALLGGAVAAGMILYRHFVPASSDRGVPYGTVVAVAALLQLLFL